MKLMQIIVTCCFFYMPGQSFAGDDLLMAVDQGKTIAFDRKRGNCLACHKIKDGISPGDIGPELVDISHRYDNKQDIFQRIWDETRFNPESPMPPFGKHNILTKSEINHIVEFIWTL